MDKAKQWGRGIPARLIDFRWPLLLLMLLATVGLLSQIKHIRMDNSNESAFIKDDPAVTVLNQFKSDFGNDDFVYILIAREQSVLDGEFLQQVGNLASQLQAEVPYLKKMSWLGNAEQITSERDGVRISPLFNNRAPLELDMHQLRDTIGQNPVLENYLISRDENTTAIMLEFYPYPEDVKDARKESPPVINRVIANFPELKTFVVGGPVIDFEYDAISGQEAGQLGLGCLLLILLLLAFTLRSVGGVLIPALVIVVSLIWTLGFIGLSGIPISMMILMLPVLLICVGIGDSLHFLAEYQRKLKQGFARRQAIVETLLIVTAPCLLTTVTTAAGFLAFAATDIQPLRDMGYFSAIGVCVALLISLTLAPILVSFSFKTNTSPEQTDNDDRFTRVLAVLASIATSRPKTVVLVFALVAVVSTVGYARVQVETNTIQALAEEVPLRQAYDYVDQNMGGTMALEVVMDPGRSDGVKDPRFMEKVEAFQQYAQAHPLVWKSYSILDALKQTRQALHQDNPEFYALPAQRQQISQYLFLYELGGGEQLGRYVGFDYDKLRVQLRTSSLSTGDVRSVIDYLQQYVDENMTGDNTIGDIKVSFTGTMSWVKTLSDHVASGQKSSFIWAFLVISLLMIGVLRSIPLGLMSMLPNLFPVLLGLGVMGFTGIYMHMVLVIFAPIIIAVAVDDTIHFFFRFKANFQRTANYETAIHQTVTGVGRPLLFTTLVLVFGFSVFAFSIMDNYRDFGLLAAIAFSWALLCDLMLVPALLVLLKPLKMAQGETSEVSLNSQEAQNG